MNEETLAVYNTERAKFAALDTDLYDAVKEKLYLTDPKTFETKIEEWAKQREEVFEIFKVYMAEEVKLAQEKTEVE